MGFFSSLAQLSKQGHDMQKRMDMGATMAAAQASMTQASQFLAAAAPVATSATDETLRISATAVVTSAAQAPMRIGMNAMVELDLIVSLPGGVPVPVRRMEQLTPLHIARVVPGATLAVSLVPGRTETLRIEWAT